MKNIGIDLHKAQSAGSESPQFWATKAMLQMFSAGELVGKLGKMEIYTISEHGNHSVFAWVKVGLNDGYDLFLGKSNMPVNSNEVWDVWL